MNKNRIEIHCTLGCFEFFQNPNKSWSIKRLDCSDHKQTPLIEPISILLPGLHNRFGDQQPGLIQLLPFDISPDLLVK